MDRRRRPALRQFGDARNHGAEVHAGPAATARATSYGIVGAIQDHSRFCRGTQNYVGATNIALDSVGAADIALDYVGAADIDLDYVGAITIARDYVGAMGSSLVLLSGQYSSLLVRSGRSILTTQFYRPHTVVWGKAMEGR